MGTKIKVILYLLIVLGVGCLMVKLNMQKKDIENLTLKLTVCENNLEKANIKAGNEELLKTILDLVKQ